MSSDDRSGTAGFAGRFRDQLGSKAVEPLVTAVRAELSSARAEIAERARGARAGAVLLAVGAVLGVVTVGLLAAAAVSLIALALPLWASTLITFAVFAAATAVVVAIGLRGIRRGVPPVPADTVRHLTSSPE